MCTPVPQRAQSRRHINSATARRVATRISELITLGKIDIERIEAIVDELPCLALRDYAHALACFRAEIGMPGYVLRQVRP